MPSVEENLNQWSDHDWSSAGDEWSIGYGGTGAMWAWTILPRIAALLPSEHILEIAPGFGRVTQYLAPACNRLTLVDLTERCIDACRTRFGHLDHVEFHLNDGTSLAMIEDDSIDVVLSWDSLIHVEDDVLSGYLTQLATRLRPGGVGFFHHSNLAEYRRRGSRRLSIANEHWRATSVSAATVRRSCRKAGLECLVQEQVPWGGANFTDCFTTFRRPSRAHRGRRRPRIYRNHQFFEQVQHRRSDQIRRIAEIYQDAHRVRKSRAFRSA